MSQQPGYLPRQARYGFKRPESVLVVVYTNAREVLLMRRRRPRHFWQSVTGSLEWGETPAAAATRELAEETGLARGIVLHDCDLRFRFPVVPPWRRRYAPTVRENLEHVFDVQLPVRRSVKLAHREHAEYCWMPATDALARVTSWTNRQAIRACVLAGDPR